MAPFRSRPRAGAARSERHGQVLRFWRAACDLKGLGTETCHFATPRSLAASGCAVRTRRMTAVGPGRRPLGRATSESRDLPGVEERVRQPLANGMGIASANDEHPEPMRRRTQIHPNFPEGLPIALSRFFRGLCGFGIAREIYARVAGAGAALVLARAASSIQRSKQRWRRRSDPRRRKTAPA